MKKIKKEFLTDKILEFVGQKSLDFLDLGLKIMFDPKEIIRTYGVTLYRNPSYIAKTVYSLKKSPYFKQQNEKFYITEKGRAQIIRNIIKSKNKKLNDSWLGIIFDIPESNRRERSFLRKELRAAGCKELQKSVWITPFDIEKELLALLKLWKKDFTGDIRFLKIDKISEENQIKKRFI